MGVLIRALTAVVEVRVHRSRYIDDPKVTGSSFVLPDSALEYVADVLRSDAANGEEQCLNSIDFTGDPPLTD